MGYETGKLSKDQIKGVAASTLSEFPILFRMTDDGFNAAILPLPKEPFSRVVVLSSLQALGFHDKDGTMDIMGDKSDQVVNFTPEGVDRLIKLGVRSRGGLDVLNPRSRIKQ